MRECLLDRWLLLGLWLLTGLALAQPLRWEDLRPQPGPQRQQLQALLKRLPSKVQGPGWQHTPLGVGGGFVGETWLLGKGHVLNRHFMSSPGSAWYRLQTLHYKLPDTFGLVVSAGRNPYRNGVGVRFRYSSGGQKIVGDSADLSFQLWQSGTVGPTVPILRYPIQISGDYELPPHWLKERPMSRLDTIRSATQLREVAREGYADILPALHKALTQGLVQRKVYGRYQGKGIPPPVHFVEITPAESHKLEAEVEQQVALWSRALEQHSIEFYAAYRQLIGPW